MFLEEFTPQQVVFACLVHHTKTTWWFQNVLSSNNWLLKFDNYVEDRRR